MTPEERTQIEAAAWRTLVGHLQKRTDVQNIDLMIEAGFCRNCMSRWLANAANAAGIALDQSTAREWVYGMTYDEWKTRYQKTATAEQMARFKQIPPEQTTE
jgi:hypothetical protein